MRSSRLAPVGQAITASLLLLTGAAESLRAQSVVRVVDKDSLPIAFALVGVGGSSERVADSLGLVRFSLALGTSVRLQVRRLGFRPFIGDVTRGADGEFVVVLDDARQTVEAMRVVAPRSTPLSRTGFYDRLHRVQNGAITGEFLTPEELERRNPLQISQALRGLRSVTVSRMNGDGQNRALILGRGGQCGMTILLDGQRVNGTLEQEIGANAMRGPGSRAAAARPPMGGSAANTTSRAGLSIDDLVVANNVMAIEVYPSAANAPAELRPLTGNGSCGIVALWTGARR